MNTKLDKLRNFAKSCIENDHEINTNWLKQMSYSAVPVPTPINLMDAEWLATACNKRNILFCYAIDTFNLDSNELVEFDVSNKIEIIRFFKNNDLTAGSNVIFFPENMSFTYLVTKDDYFIVAGTNEFVRESIGCSYDTARKIFDEYADDNITWGDSQRKLLMLIANKYRQYGHD